MKKIGVIILLCMILSGIVLANKIEITTTKDNYNPGENITLKVSVYDDNNIPIDSEVAVTLEDAEKKTTINENIISNQFRDIKLDNNAYSGYWKISAKYGNNETSSLIMVNEKENVKFELDNDILTITNLGNTKYEKTIQIAIGDTIGTKKVTLERGEKVSTRLTAPDGAYNVKITDGKELLTKSGVQLTGEVIGTFDENAGTRDPITGINPENDSNFISILKDRKFVYVFIAVIIGATILLAIERNYRRKVGY